MKKIVAWLLSSALFATAIAGLAGCRDDHKHVDNNGDGKCDECNEQFTEHTRHPDEDQDGKCDFGGETIGGDIGEIPDDFVRPKDPRDRSAYEVHAKDGTLIGSYVSIADAISAAVENDLDDFEAEDGDPLARGSYVVKKGSTRKLFENMRAYSENKGDVYWYYQDNGLAGYEYYEQGVPVSHLHNSKEIAYMSGSGVEATQTFNGYGVYDGRGEQLGQDKVNLSSVSWEIVINTDASICGIPVREHGATGARYTVDLSEVQIKPAYEGVDDEVYAFIGFVMASGTYSAEVGIACNTKTGEWKQYISDNPINRGDEVCANYNIGETIFTSTWHADGGYFTPDIDSVTLEVNEVKDDDENGDEWWYNLVEITAGDKKVEVLADEDFLNEHGNTGVTFDTKEGFFFRAGLDIVAPGAEVGNSIDPVDYTIGAEFNNLIVEKGEIYFPAVDEIDDTDYGTSIPAELRGEYHDIRSEGFQGRGEGIYNYTILNLLACCDYEINDDGFDTYSFHYTAPEGESSDRAGQLKVYQDKIDSLKAITKENAGQYKTTIDEVTVWYGPDGKPENSKVELRHYLAIDWAPYKNALEVYKDAVQVGAEAQKIIDAMAGFTSIESLGGWKGWKAPEGTKDTKGYFYNELEQFRALYEIYEGLSEADCNGILTVVGDAWMYWEELLTDYDAAMESAFATKQFTISNFEMTDVETKTGAQLFEEFFEYEFKASGYADKNTHSPVSHGGALCVEPGGEGDDHFRTTFRLLFINELLKEEEVPLGYSELAIELLENTNPGNGTPHDFPYIYHTMRQAVRVLRGDCTYLDEELAEMVNTYMVDFEYQNGTWKWAWYVNGGDINISPQMKWRLYFGKDLQDTGKTFRDLIVTYLLPYIQQVGGNMPAKQPYTQYDAVMGVAVDKAVKPAELDAAGKAWSAKWTAADLSDLTTLSPDIWKGWKAADNTVKGYLGAELEKFNELYTEFLTLTDLDQAIIAKELGAPWKLWVGLSKDYKAAQTSSFGKLSFKVKGETFTGAQLIDEFFTAVYAISVPEYGPGTKPTGKQVRYLAANDVGFDMSWRAMYIKTLLDENFVKIGYVDTLIELLSGKDTENQYDGTAFITDFKYFYNVLGQVAKVESGTKQLTYHMATVVNTYMVGFKAFHEPNWVYGFNNGGALQGILDVAKDYFGITVAEGANFADVIKPMLDIVVQGGGNGVEVNEKGIGVTVEVTVPEQTEFYLADIIREFRNLSDLNALSAWKGFNDKEEKGYLQYELGLFNTLLEHYNKLEEGVRPLVVEQVGEKIWTQWKTLAEQVGALDAKTQDINVKVIGDNGESSNTVKVTQLNVFGGMLDRAFFQNTNTKCTHKGNGYLCCEENVCFLNSIRYYYLYRLSKTLKLNVDYIDVVYEMLKANGATSNDNAVPTLPNGARTLLDFDYLWAVGGQIVRIIKGECTYLDKELAEVVNKYMVANENKAGQWGIRESFHNGTFAYAYRILWSEWGGDRAGTPVGDIKDGAFNWKFYIDDAFMDETLNPKNQYGFYKTWSELLATYLNPILLRDAGSDILKGVRDGAAKDLVAPMLVTRTVTALESDPNKTDESIQEVFNTYNALALPTLTDVHSIKGATTSGDSTGYLYPSVQKFETFYTEQFEKLEAPLKGKLITKIGAEVWEGWVSLMNDYKALKAIQTKYSVIKADFAETPVEMSAFDLVNEFINCALKYWEGNKADSASGGAFGYFCAEHQDHALNTLRALYLHKLIEVNGLETTFKFAHKLLDMIIHNSAEEGVSKYTGITESEGAYKDFEYVWNVGKQIVRIMDGLNYIDEELAKVVNTYMLATTTPDSIAKERPYGFGVRETFHSLGFSDAYRNHAWDGKGDLLVGTGTKDGWTATKYAWKRYIDPKLETAQQASWSTLMDTYLTPILKASDADIMVEPASNVYGSAMCVKHTVTAGQAPVSATIDAFNVLNDTENVDVLKPTIPAE